MRALVIIVLLLVAHLCPAEQQRALPENAHIMYTCIALLVAEHYVAHHTWPASTEQLHRYVAQLSPQLRPDERKVFATVWSCINHFEFKPRGKNLFLSARFHSEGYDYSYASVLHAGHSAEDIADRMTPK
jgi:hypothetical protein